MNTGAWFASETCLGPVGRSPTDTRLLVANQMTKPWRNGFPATWTLSSLKALRRDVTLRYPTVEAFAEDLQRHLQFLPVRARGDSALYRTKRFLRRNRVSASSAFGILLALAMGLSIALYQRNFALEQKAEAERETARVKELIRQRSDMVESLQKQVADSGMQDQQFRMAVASLTKDFHKMIHDDELLHGKNRGESLSNRIRLAWHERRDVGPLTDPFGRQKWRAPSLPKLCGKFDQRTASRGFVRGDDGSHASL